MRAIRFAALAVAGLLQGCGSVLGWADDGSHGAIAACEDAIRGKVVSPTSYKRVWANFTERPPLDVNERAEWYDRAGCSVGRAKASSCTRTPTENLTTAYLKQLERAIAAKRRLSAKLNDEEQAHADSMARLAATKTGFVLLEYDATNAFGAVVRGFGMCRFGPPGGDGVFTAGTIFQQGPVPREEGEAAKLLYNQADGTTR